MNDEERKGRAYWYCYTQYCTKIQVIIAELLEKRVLFGEKRVPLQR
jgi:hypothetical protein